MCYTEAEFATWFEFNTAWFGIQRIVKLDVFFPDCRAELYDGRWVDIELEYYARNFIHHGHPHTCDLIIAFCAGPNTQEVAGIPVISVFEVNDYRAVGDFDYEHKRLSPYFQRLVETCQSQLENTLTSFQSGNRAVSP